MVQKKKKKNKLEFRIAAKIQLFIILCHKFFFLSWNAKRIQLNETQTPYGIEWIFMSQIRRVYKEREIYSDNYLFKIWRKKGDVTL